MPEQTSTSKLTTKGIFILSVLDVIKKVKGPKGVDELKALYGDIDFSSFKDYPMEQEIALNRAAVKVIYGKDTPQNWEKFGQLAFSSYSDTILGKTMFALLGKDLIKVLLMMNRIIETVTSGYRITSKQLGPSTFQIRFHNCIDPKEYFTGIFKQGLIYFGHPPNVSVNVFGPNDYEYTLRW